MILLRDEMTGGRGESSVMCIEMGWTTWNMLDHAWALAPSPRLGFTLDVHYPIGRCYLILHRGEMYFKWEFSICHQSALLPAKHVEPTSVFHRLSEMGVECECLLPHSKEWPPAGAQREVSLQAFVHQRCIFLMWGQWAI